MKSELIENGEVEVCAQEASDRRVNGRTILSSEPLTSKTSTTVDEEYIKILLQKK